MALMGTEIKIVFRDTKTSGVNPCPKTRIDKYDWPISLRPAQHAHTHINVQVVPPVTRQAGGGGAKHELD